jgi:hypothetical protein
MSTSHGRAAGSGHALRRAAGLGALVGLAAVTPALFLTVGPQVLNALRPGGLIGPQLLTGLRTGMFTGLRPGGLTGLRLPPMPMPQVGPADVVRVSLIKASYRRRIRDIRGQRPI